MKLHFTRRLHAIEINWLAQIARRQSFIEGYNYRKSPVFRNLLSFFRFLFRPITLVKSEGRDGNHLQEQATKHRESRKVRPNPKFVSKSPRPTRIHLTSQLEGRLYYLLRCNSKSSRFYHRQFMLFRVLQVADHFS